MHFRSFTRFRGAIAPVLIASLFIPVASFAQMNDWDMYDNGVADSEVYQGAQDSTTVRERVQSLGDVREDALRIPILLDIEVSELVDSWGDARSGGRVHQGIDILSPKGSYIVSPTRAVVAKIGYGANGGNYVYTLNPGGERLYFAHLDGYAPGLKVGDLLEVGDHIGYVGNTGNASAGPNHLHLGIYDRGAQNPFPRLTRSWSLEERMSALGKIIARSADPAKEVEHINTNHAGLIKEATAKGVSLPQAFQEEVKSTALAKSVCELGKNITLGTEGSAVRSLQQTIITAAVGEEAKSLAKVGATGYYGKQTERALKEYMNSLGVCGERAITRDLSLNMRGDDVKWLQQYLIDKKTGVAAKELAKAGATGSFGPMTARALKEYQRAMGISPATGYFGPMTRTHLIKAGHLSLK